MKIDLGPLLRHLLAAAPLAAAGGCWNPYACDRDLDTRFDDTVLLTATQLEHVTDHLSRSPPPETDAGPFRRALTSAESEAFPACLRDARRCKPLCAAIADKAFDQSRVDRCEVLRADGDRLQLRVGGAGTNLVCGRRPEGIARAEGEGAGLGAHLARAAFLEAASVPAFLRLERELRAHGAPARLCLLARAAARDEARHARLTRRLAARHGSRVLPVGRCGREIRPLEEVAIENAIEGCVRETYGALLAGWQAAAARDAEIAALMAEIAPDETRHANLAWEVDRWASRRLSPGSRRRVGEARRAAVLALRDGVGDDDGMSAEQRARAGLPAGAVRGAMIEGLDHGLWAQS